MWSEGSTQVSRHLYVGKLGKGAKKFTAVEDTGQKEWGNLYPATKTFRAVIKRSFDCSTVICFKKIIKWLLLKEKLKYIC